MGRLLLRRLVAAVPTIVGASLVAFILIRLVPGDPVTVLLGERGGSPEVVAELKSKLGLDQSFPKQYFRFLANAARGDLGESIVSRRSVWQEFKDRFPATVELGLCALFVAVLIGIPLGIAAAVNRNSWIDRLAMGISLLGYSMPIFWWGLILILVFSLGFGLTPVAGRMGLAFDVEVHTGFMLIDAWWTDQPWETFKEAIRHLILPTLALSTVPMAAIARMTRSSMLEVLREDYVRTAEAKGLTHRQVVIKHAATNALIPIITVIGLMGSTLLTGAILTETIFAWPGIGKWLVASVMARDYPVIQGGLLLVCAVVVCVNIFVDLLYMLANPMIRARHE
jgi:dipeptide transport system permease protein